MDNLPGASPFGSTGSANFDSRLSKAAVAVVLRFEKVDFKLLIHSVEDDSERPRVNWEAISSDTG